MMFRALLFILLLICTPAFLRAQKTPDRLIKKVVKYNKLLKEDKIPELYYLKQVDSLLDSFFMNFNGFLPHDSLLALLEPYREKAMSKGDKYATHKAGYYYFLATNADIRGEGGRAIYYSDKVIKEKAKAGEKSILKIGLSTNYYSRNNNLGKVIALYEKEQPFFLEYQKLLLNNKLSPTESVNFIGLQTIVFGVYLKLKDHANAEKIMVLTEKMTHNLNERKDVSLTFKIHSFLYFNSMKIELLSNEGKSAEALHLLQQTEIRIKEHKDTLKDKYTYLEEMLNDLKMDYLISFSLPDEGLKLLDSTHTKGLVSHYNSLHTETKRADLLFKKGDYQSAYNTLKKSLTFQEQEYVTITNEMEELLYAHSEAEQNRLELLDAEKEKKKKNLIFSLVIASVSLVSIAIAFYYHKDKKQFKKIVTELNKTTEVQIEEAKNRAALEEKVKLGQNLHDDMSGTLAGMLRLIEATEDNTKEKKTADNLGLLYLQTKNIYSSVRTKSHQMYNDTENDYFEDSVKKIVNTALLHYGYKTEIEVDRVLAAQLSTTLRIELLRIIQESVTNILKHAKRATEAYVFMFKEGDSIFLQIGDNGLPQKSSKYSGGIGLKSIADRVKALHGEFSINKTNGMNLNISFPIPESDLIHWK